MGDYCSAVLSVPHNVKWTSFAPPGWTNFAPPLTGEDALYAVVSVSACYNLYNRLVSGLDLGADEGYLDAVAERLTRGARKGG